MNHIYKAQWIKAAGKVNPCVPEFRKSFDIKKSVKKAELSITALGVFYAELNEKKIGSDVLAPGWTSYAHRLQYMVYDVTDLLCRENLLTVGVGRGWRFHQVKQWGTRFLTPDTPALLCALSIEYKDGTQELILTDRTWTVRKSHVVYNDMYNGETYDVTRRLATPVPAAAFPHTKQILLPLQGEPIREHERFTDPKLILTPKGETVLDFGQNLTGYVELHVNEKFGDTVTLKHFEVLDKSGNVYTENLRSARQELTIVCDGTDFVYKPHYTFYGFRYVQVIGMKHVDPADFTAIVVHSDIRRTGYFTCSHELLNRFYHNVIWGQKGNFLDIPTDCPQRDERLGWTGDAQVFARTAAINFDVERFFDKWLSDLAAEQGEDGRLPNTCPVRRDKTGDSSPAWTDAALIIPWRMYQAYGDKKRLIKTYPMMKKYVDYMAAHCEKKAAGTGRPFAHPWTNEGFGDWLSLDNPDPEETNGRTDKGLIATAYLAYDLRILLKVGGDMLGEDMSYYENLYEDTLAFFRKEYMKDGRMLQDTQTAPVLALYFELSDDPNETAKQLVEIVERDGRLTTGFVGTAYLLHALSMAGRDDLAVDLLLREDYPSWLYPVTRGATTVWERWNGIHPDGRFASKDMNSFNHYAYGAVFDWIFSRLAGIDPCEDAPGYRHVRFAPAPDPRIDYVKCGIESRQGRVESEYRLNGTQWSFTFTVPEGVRAEAEIFGVSYPLTGGVNMLSVRDERL